MEDHSPVDVDKKPVWSTQIDHKVRAQTLGPVSNLLEAGKSLAPAARMRVGIIMFNSTCTSKFKR